MWYIYIYIYIYIYSTYILYTIYSVTYIYHEYHLYVYSFHAFLYHVSAILIWYSNSIHHHSPTLDQDRGGRKGTTDVVIKVKRGYSKRLEGQQWCDKNRRGVLRVFLTLLCYTKRLRCLFMHRYIFICCVQIASSRDFNKKKMVTLSVFIFVYIFFIFLIYNGSHCGWIHTPTEYCLATYRDEFSYTINLIYSTIHSLTEWKVFMLWLLLKIVC